MIDKYYKKYDKNHQKFENYPKTFPVAIDDTKGISLEVNFQTTDSRFTTSNLVVNQGV